MKFGISEPAEQGFEIVDVDHNLCNRGALSESNGNAHRHRPNTLAFALPTSFRSPSNHGHDKEEDDDEEVIEDDDNEPASSTRTFMHLPFTKIRTPLKLKANMTNIFMQMQSSKSKKFGGIGLGVWFLIILAIVGVSSVSVGIVVHRQKKAAMMISTTMVSTIEPECEETPVPVIKQKGALVASVPDDAAAAAAVSTKAKGYEKNGDKGTKQSLLKRSDQVKKDLGVVGVPFPTPTPLKGKDRVPSRKLLSCPGSKGPGPGTAPGFICTQTPQSKCNNNGNSECEACAAQKCPGLPVVYICGATTDAGFSLDKCPSEKPSLQPSESPSVSPSVSKQPSDVPSESPSVSLEPSVSSQPSAQPSESPSESKQPSAQPSSQPSSQPSNQPSSEPSSQPSAQPSAQPSFQPSESPSVSKQPSDVPSESPSVSLEPSESPSKQPTESPSSKPSESPSKQPSQQPSVSSQPTESSKPSVSSQPSTSTAGGKTDKKGKKAKCTKAPKSGLRRA